MFQRFHEMKERKEGGFTLIELLGRKATGPRWGPAELPVAGTVRRGPPLAGEAQRFVMSLTGP